MRFTRTTPHPKPHSFPEERYQGFLGFKPPLRKDFQYRCAYCQFKEWHRIFGGPRTFAVDHFRPRVLLNDEEQKDYGNLCYACTFCNGSKRDHWPSDELQREGFRFTDPCSEDLIEELTDYDPETGEIQGRTPAARYTVELIDLNRAEFRKLRKRIEWAKAEAKRLRALAALMETRAADAAVLAAIADRRAFADRLEREDIDPIDPSYE